MDTVQADDHDLRVAYLQALGQVTEARRGCGFRYGRLRASISWPTARTEPRPTVPRLA